MKIKIISSMEEWYDTVNISYLLYFTENINYTVTNAIIQLYMQQHNIGTNNHMSLIIIIIEILKIKPLYYGDIIYDKLVKTIQWRRRKGASMFGLGEELKSHVK